MIGGLDRRDNFQAGHGIRGGPTLRMRKIPKWMYHEKSVGEVLLRAFPKLRTDERQRQSAARWAGIILLYFKSGWKAEDVAEKLDISRKKVYDTAQRITRSGAGLRTTGKQRTGRRGRPKKTNYF